ncbi:MAG TPA: DUF3560 domain-containing protein, partial [Polyangiaceae bacterium]
MALSQVDSYDPALANLQILRQRLREALYSKKTRLRELAELCKRQRAELRAWVKDRRAYALAQLRDELRAARGTAQATRRSRLQEARRSSTSAVELARAAVEIERAHAAEQLRITRTHETKRVAVDKGHARSLTENVMSASTLKRLAPLLDKAKNIRPAPGESRTEALWRYAHAHPEEMHALLEPATEKAIVQTRKEIAAAEEAIRTGAYVSVQRSRAKHKASSPKAPLTRGAKSPRLRSASKPAALATTVAAPVVPAAEPMEPQSPEAVVAPTPAPMAVNASSAPVREPELPPSRRAGRPRKPRAQLGLDFDAPSTPAPEAAANDVAPAAVAPSAEGAESNPYEQKKAARIDRQRKRAGKLRGEAEAAHTRAKTIGDMIPMGQPILVGHHSQRRHERDLGKMHTAMTKSVELTRAADKLERRANRAEKSDAVSSDDPEAVAKLRVKLADMDKGRTRMREANAAIRAG